jgi:Kef-type K+ transport system membrane component KefB
VLLAEAAAILVAAKVAGQLATRFGQPPVLGQLLAGVVLGLLSTPLQGFADFDAANLQVAHLADLGVILLMFLAGLETDTRQVRATGKAAFVSACFGVVVPLIGGVAVGRLFGLNVVEAVFVGVILTATSVSITAQTLMELGSLQTIEGATILGAAVIDDVIGLVVFSVVVAATGSGGAQMPLPVLAVALVAFFGAATFVGPRLVTKIVNAAATVLHDGEGLLAVALAVGLAFGFAAQVAGLAAITGAYIAGLLINRHNEHEDLIERVKVIGYGFFVPIFLVRTGMEAQVTDLGSTLAFVVAATALAIVSKIVGCGFGARIAGLSTRQSLVVGVGMISRGEVALVVATLALSAGAISQLVFSSAVVVVLATTLVTPPLLRIALGRGAIQPAPILVSDGA